MTVLGATDAPEQLSVAMGGVRVRAVLIALALYTSAERELTVQGGDSTVGVGRATSARTRIRFRSGRAGVTRDIGADIPGAGCIFTAVVARVCPRVG